MRTRRSNRIISASTKRQIYALLVLLGAAVLPFLVVFTNGRVNYVDFPKAVYDVFVQLFTASMAKNLFFHSILIGSTLSIVLFSALLLFELDVSPESVRQHRFWGRFIIKEKRVWHILLGYLITFLLLGADVGERFSQTQNVTLYQGEMIAPLILILVIVFTRALSKIRLGLIDTNLGVFIIIIYFSEVVFGILTVGFVPLETLWMLIQNADNNLQNVATVYYANVIGAIIATVLDWIVITKVLGKKL